MQHGFVDLCLAVPGIQAEVRYATAHNLTGHPLAGYLAPKAIGTVESARALKIAYEAAQQLGYGLLIYDAYRPQKAVGDFVSWSQEQEDGRTKEEFYPELEKEQLFPLGYIARRSGHSRGSVVDLTLTKEGKPVDMGTAFDFMSDRSHHGYANLTEEQLRNRAILRAIMAWAGYESYECEWWHYRLMDEPYPDQYFDFDVQ